MARIYLKAAIHSIDHGQNKVAVVFLARAMGEANRVKDRVMVARILSALSWIRRA